MKCAICDRPIKNGGPYCQLHARELTSERETRKARTRKDAFAYVTYRGHVVAFFQDGGDKLRPSYVGMSVNGIPKSKLINLDSYAPGFTREQVRKLKAVVCRLANI